MLPTWIFAASLLLAHADPIKIHIAPNGNDAASGLDPVHPLATLAAAITHARSLRASVPQPSSPIHIQLAAGIYVLPETLTLAPADSGTATSPLIIAAEQPGTVTLSGGIQLPPWVACEPNPAASDRIVWKTQLPAAATRVMTPDAPLRSLWVNGQRRTWARYPSAGSFATIESIPNRPAGDWMVGPSSFQYRQQDAAAWNSLSHASLTTFTRWIDTHLSIASITKDTRTATFTHTNLISLDPGDLYFIEGARELLDEPGEWWSDPQTGTIYMIPLPGDALDAPSVVPVLSELLHIGSSGNDSTPVSNITFEGITFQYARWWFPEVPAAGSKAAGFMQAAAGAPGAVVCEHSNHVTFNQCTIRHVEGYGLELRGGCTDHRITRCTITGLGAGGIKIGQPSINEGPERTGTNTVEDCTVTDGGHLHHQAVGIWIGQSDHNIIRHNRIAEFDYTGISIGWTWGYGASAAAGNLVEWNDIGFLGKRSGNTQAPLGDMGGIYTLGGQPGTIIRNNYFHDIAGHTIAWGIYFDEGSTDIIAENNIVLSTSHGAFHQHYGKNNIVRGNLLMNGAEPQLWRTRREEHNSFTLEDNVVVGEQRLWHNGDWTSGFALRHNLYWQSKPAQVPFPGKRTLTEWQAAGWDVDSIVADPKLDLTDPLHPTFGANADPALKAWALPDLRSIGPRPLNH